MYKEREGRPNMICPIVLILVTQCDTGEVTQVLRGHTSCVKVRVVTPLCVTCSKVRGACLQIVCVSVGAAFLQYAFDIDYTFHIGLRSVPLLQASN